MADPRARVARNAHTGMHQNISNPAPKPRHMMLTMPPKIGLNCAPSDFQVALQAAIDDSYVLQLNAPIVLDQPIEVVIRSSNVGWFGLDGNMNKIVSTVHDGPAIIVRMDDSTPSGTCARSMFFGNFSL